MNKSMSEQLLLIADVVWRRKRLLIMPFLIILPLLAAYLKFGPRPYAAKSLLLLQENVRDSFPLRDSAGFVNMSDRIGGLQGLLKSDRVLHAVMIDILGDKAPTDPESVALFKYNITEALSIELIGNDFLQLQLKDTSPKDLGRKLEAIVTRFIEALLPAQDVPSAMQAIVERRKEELDLAEQEVARLRSEIGAGLPIAVERESVALSQEKAKLERALGRLEELAKLIASLRAESGSQSAAQPGSELATAEAQQAKVRDEAKSISGAIELHERKLRELGKWDDRLKFATEEAAKARESYQAFSSRYRAPMAPGNSPTILKAPERIKLIDLPRDPVFPATPARKIILVLIGLAFALSAGLVIAAELLDGTMRVSERFEQLAGVPILARLPGPGVGSESLA